MGLKAIICRVDVLVFTLTLLIQGYLSLKPRHSNLKHHLKHRDEVESDFPYKNLRLPGDITPFLYRVFLHANLTSFDVKGRVGILIRCKEATSRILLHSKENNIRNVALATGNVHSIEETEKNDKHPYRVPVKEFKESEKLEMLSVELEKPLEKGKDYTLIISFTGELKEKLDGFYRSTYKTKSGEKRYIATTQFQATAARSAFPCFDEPQIKAEFEITLVRESRHVALSNMPIKETVTREDKLLEDHFQKSVSMSTYLVAFVICDFKYKEAKTKRGVTVRVWAPEDKLDQTDVAIDAAPKILNDYNDFFGVDFPLPKQDLIAIPDFDAGAMENWGLITYRETALLYDPKTSSVSDKQWVVVVIAHELAHQWFGNLVTMKWWNDLWLNEGFASYVEFLGTANYSTSWKMMDQFTVEDIQSSMELDSLSNSHAISVDVQDPSQISELFDSISYYKGASIIRMLASFIGQKAFHDGLRNYLKAYDYDNAETDDLWRHLSKTSGTNVKEVMDTWTRQMGFPVVTIVRDPENPNQAIATQKHFLNDPKASPSVSSPFNYKWEIPLTYIMKSGEKTTTNTIKWMQKDGTPLKFPWKQSDGWIKGNIDTFGFYRCNYDESNWKALIAQLKENHEVVSAIDRANLIDDAFALAQAKQLDQILALEISTYIEKEMEYVPYITVMSSLGKVSAFLVDRPGFVHYKAYIVKILKPLLEKIGWNDDGDHLRKKLRERVLMSSVANGDQQSIDKVKEMFKNWKSKDEEIPVNLLDAVLLGGIRYGTKEDWDFLWGKQKSTHVAIFQNKMVSALTQSHDTALLKKILEYSLDDSKIKPQDATTVIIRVGRNSKAGDMAWNFVKANWDKLFKLFGKTTAIASIIKDVPGRFVTKEKLDDVEAFFKDRNLGAGARSAKQVVEEIKGNIDWIQRNEQRVTDWLKSKTGS